MTIPKSTTTPPELQCEDQVGSINTTEPNPSIGPYIPTPVDPGDWEITDPDPDQCAINEVQIQEQYIAETINISGAPLNVYTLKGIHQQGDGSVLSQGTIFGSTAFPGHPISGINNDGGTPWWSYEMGSNIVGTSFVGVDFGIKKTDDGNSEYEPQKTKWTDVGAVVLTQSNNTGYFASQVKVEITDGRVIIGTPNPDIYNAGDGDIEVVGPGSDAAEGTVMVETNDGVTFEVNWVPAIGGSPTLLGEATLGETFYSTYLNFTINQGSIPFQAGDNFGIPISYYWTRAGIFNVIQSPDSQVLNLKSTLKVRAVRVTPTLFTGNQNWEVLELDVLDSAPVDINNIQDLFFGENRDRDYNATPIMLKAAYTPADSVSDLSKFGLSILDQYTFTFSFADMVTKLGRPIVIGDIIEVIPEMQWDQNLKPIRKFLEVTDSGWATSGFGPHYKPVVYRVHAQQALPSQETRDIFGTLDTQKYLVADDIVSDDIGEQLNTTPLTIEEEIGKMADDAVPEIGSDDIRAFKEVRTPQARPPANAKGQPAALSNPSPSQGPNLYIEAALPPEDEPYGEGFALPEIPGPADGDYFRLLYPPETQIPARLYRFSELKNRWIYLETDRRGQYSSIKPSVRRIMESSTSQSIGKKI